MFLHNNLRFGRATIFSERSIDKTHGLKCDESHRMSARFNINFKNVNKMKR